MTTLRELEQNGHQIASDGKSVWVNDGMGGCVARFGRGGIDIHSTTAEQIANGLACRFCTHALPTPMEWDLFRAKVEEFHGVRIPNLFMPLFIVKALPNDPYQDRH